MTVNLVRYVMECVRADNPDATPEQLVDLYAEALKAADLITKE